MSGQAGAGCLALVDAHIDPLRIEYRSESSHAKLHQGPEGRSLLGGIGQQRGLGLAQRHEQVAVGVGVPIEHDQPVIIAVNHMVGVVRVGGGECGGDEVVQSAPASALVGIESFEILHAPRRPEGIVHGQSIRA